MNFILIVAAVIIIDQISKYVVVKNFFLGESVPVIPDIFHWTYILNQGAAFGMLEGSRWLFILIALAVSAGIWYFRGEIGKEPVMVRFGAALFTGGAVGNLIDRILRGAVIDFFDFRIWPIFNVADIAICIGVGMILWKLITAELLERRNA